MRYDYIRKRYVPKQKVPLKKARFRSLKDVMVLLHGHAGAENGWSSRTSKTCCMAHSLCRSMADSDRNRSFSLLTSWPWCVTTRSRFSSSRFPILSRFTWFLRFSRCFFFRIRDRLADSRFEIIRLRFRSSGINPVWFVSSEPGLSEPEFEKKGFGFGFSDPELDITGSGGVCEFSEPELDITGLSAILLDKKDGSCSWKGKKGSWHSHGGKPPSKAENGVPNIPSTDGKAGKADNMARKTAYNKGGRWEEEREGTKGVGWVFMDNEGECWWDP
ncbi:hypothetical protein C3L33_01327, partial [Rhododendron williamsianum]